MNISRSGAILSCACLLVAGAGCGDEQFQSARMELTQGAAEFVGVMKEDLVNALALLQEKLDQKVMEDRMTAASSSPAGDGLPQPQNPSGPETIIGPEDGPYLFDLLERRAFLKSWLAMFEGVHGLPDWIGRFNDSRDGVATPSATVRRGDDTWLLTSVCEPHNCGYSFITVLFTRDGRHAWGLFINDDSRTWLNNPEPWMLKVLEAD